MDLHCHGFNHYWYRRMAVCANNFGNSRANKSNEINRPNRGRFFVSVAPVGAFFTPKDNKMKQFSINLFIKFCVTYTGKSQQELAKKWGIYYLLTRSKTKAYWCMLFS